jgi:hypothetical protein
MPVPPRCALLRVGDHLAAHYSEVQVQGSGDKMNRLGFLLVLSGANDGP